MFAMYSEEAYQARIKELILVTQKMIKSVESDCDLLPSPTREVIAKRCSNDLEEIKAILEKHLIAEPRYNAHDTPLCPDCGRVIDRPVLGKNICLTCDKNIKISVL